MCIHYVQATIAKFCKQPKVQQKDFVQINKKVVAYIHNEILCKDEIVQCTVIWIELGGGSR